VLNCFNRRLFANVNAQISHFSLNFSVPSLPLASILFLISLFFFSVPSRCSLVILAPLASVLRIVAAGVVSLVSPPLAHRCCSACLAFFFFSVRNPSRFTCICIKVRTRIPSSSPSLFGLAFVFIFCSQFVFFCLVSFTSTMFLFSVLSFFLSFLF